MKTVKIIKTNELVPSPFTNPFPIHVGKGCLIAPNMITHVDSGMKIFLPKDCSLVVESIGETVILGHTIIDDQLFICVTTMKFVPPLVLNEGDKIALCRIVKQEDEEVRFVDTTGGKHILFSEGRPIQQEETK